MHFLEAPRKLICYEIHSRAWTAGTHGSFSGLPLLGEIALEIGE